MVKQALILALVALAIPAPAAASKITIVTASDAGGDDPAMENPYAGSMEQALTYISNGEPGKAIEIYDLVIAAYEKDYPAGMAFCGDTSADALEAAMSAPLVEQDIEVFALGPAWCEALWGKGFALIDLKRYHEAEPYLTKAVEMAPGSGHYANELGEFYKLRNEWQRSFDIFSKALATSEKDKNDSPRVTARALRGMGYAAIEMQRWDEAETLFNRSLEFDPGNPIAKSELQYIASHKAVRGKD